MDEIAALLADFQRSLRVAGRSPRTIQSYTESVTQFVAHAGASDPQQLDRAALRVRRATDGGGDAWTTRAKPGARRGAGQSQR